MTTRNHNIQKKLFRKKIWVDVFVVMGCRTVVYFYRFSRRRLGTGVLGVKTTAYNPQPRKSRVNGTKILA